MLYSPSGTLLQNAHKRVCVTHHLSHTNPGRMMYGSRRVYTACHWQPVVCTVSQLVPRVYESNIPFRKCVVRNARIMRHMGEGYVKCAPCNDDMP